MPPKRDQQLHASNSNSHNNNNNNTSNSSSSNISHATPTTTQQTPQQPNDSIGATLRVRANMLHAAVQQAATNGLTSHTNGNKQQQQQQRNDNNTSNGNGNDWANEQRQQQFETNARLCRLVEKCPWMYDRHHANYAKKSVLDKSWARIARDCNETVASAKERWRNIRAAFARSINIYKTHGGPNRVKPYYLHAELQFLIKPMMDGREKHKYDSEANGDLEDSRQGGMDSEADEDERRRARRDESSECHEPLDSKELSEPDDASASTMPEMDRAATEQERELANLEPEMAINSDEEYASHAYLDDRQRYVQQQQQQQQQQQHGRSAAAMNAAQHYAYEHATNTATATLTMPRQQSQHHYHSNGESTKMPPHACQQHNYTFGHDADAKFLEALLPDMQAMDRRQKIIFKRKIYQSIEEVMDIPTNAAHATLQQHMSPTAAQPPPPSSTTQQSVPVASSLNAEKLQMLQHIFNMPDEDVQRYATIFQQQQQQQLQLQNITSAVNQRNSTTLTIIPRGSARKRNAATAFESTSSAATATTASCAEGTTNAIHTASPPKAPWDQVVPIIVKGELDEVDIE